MSIIRKETFKVRGMACTKCEGMIEEALLGVSGINEVKADFSNNEVTVAYDPGVIGLKTIAAIVKDSGYTLETGETGTVMVKEAAKDKPLTALQFIGIAVVLIAVYLIINSTVGFDFIPEIKSSMGYGVLFIIGLLTSLHCVAMCGGINMSQCVTGGAVSGDAGGGMKGKVRPSLLYNLGRVTSYTIIGGIVGAIGSAISFTGWARGIVAVVSGLFMVVMGLSMTGLFPWINKITPRLPRSFREKTGKLRNGKGPYIVGLLNGLMPCGPLQAMQLYALGTGSFIAGASSMFFFSLGTVPLMFGLGAFITLLGSKFTNKMMKVSAVLVAVLGIVMLGRGLVLSGVPLPTFSIQSAQAADDQDDEASIAEGVQNITSTLAPGLYPAITVQKGIPVVWNIKADEQNINGCNRTMVIPEYDIQVTFKPGDNIIKFTPAENGTFAYSCWMGMISSSISVVDEISNSEISNNESGTYNTNNSGANNDNVSSDDASASDAGGNQSDYRIPVDEIAVAQIKDGEQIVSIDMVADRFTPAVIVVQKNIETVWIINGIDVNDNNRTLLFPKYKAAVNIEVGENPLSLLPDEDFEFLTSTSSFYGYVKVVDDISTIDLEAIKKEVSEFVPLIQEYISNSGAPSCH